MADAFAKDFQRYSETAAKHAQNAATAGRAGAADVLNKISSTFAGLANERGWSSVEAFNQKVASQALAGFAGAAKNVGPAADTIQAAAGVADLINTGDFNSLGGALSDIGGSIAGALLVAAFIAPLGLPAIAAGVVIGLRSIWRRCRQGPVGSIWRPNQRFG